MSDIANLAITFLKGFEMLELLHDPVVNTIGWLIALCLLILAFLQGDIIRGNKKTIKALLADLANMRETYDKEYEVNNKNTLENNHILVKRNTDLKSETSELEYKNRKLSAKNKELQDKLDTFRLSIDKELENKLVNAHNSHEDKVADSGEDLPEWHASITKSRGGKYRANIRDEKYIGVFNTNIGHPSRKTVVDLIERLNKAHIKISG